MRSGDGGIRKGEQGRGDKGHERRCRGPSSHRYAVYA